MVPGAFDYYSPSSLQEVLQLLQEHGEDAKILAGGHSLVPLLKLRLAEPPVLIDLAKVEELRGISRSNGSVVIGAMTTQNEIEFSEELKGVLPILPEAAAQVGDPMVRNRGTLGGSLAHADPAGDMPAVVLALDAVMSVTGPGGERTIPAGEFFIDVPPPRSSPGRCSRG
ncbi:MAG: FAD binding domain-containing protein [Chloroflexia bacterium]